MTTIAEVRTALAGAVAAGTGLRCSEYVTDAINAPCAYISRRQMDPRMVLSGAKSTYPLRVTLVVGGQSEIASQAALDLYCATSGDSSVMAAIENGSLWSGASVDYAAVTSIGETQLVDIGGIVHMSVDFDVEVVW